MIPCSKNETKRNRQKQKKRPPGKFLGFIFWKGWMKWFNSLKKRPKRCILIQGRFEFQLNENLGGKFKMRSLNKIVLINQSSYKKFRRFLNNFNAKRK